MVSSHRARQELREEHKDPENVSIIVDGIIKVIPWKELKEMEEYFPKEKEEEKSGDN